MTNSRTARSTREKAAELRAAAERAEARRRTLIVTVAVVAALLVALAAVVVVKVAQQQKADEVAASTPANTSDFGITVGQATAKVTITAYEDFQCPACKSFEDTNSAQLEKWVADGTVKIVYKPVAILDRMSTTEYSTRALNAAAAVIAADPSKFPAFHKLLFANQPAENGVGLPDSTLLDVAVQAGVEKSAVEAAITSQKYRPWTEAATEAFAKAGHTGTPTVLVNGTQLDDWSAEKLVAAVQAAAK